MSDVINYIKTLDEGDKYLLLSQVKEEPNRTFRDKIKVFKQQGFARILIDDQVVRIESIIKMPAKPFHLVVDRVIIQQNDDFYKRLADAISIAFYEGKGDCSLYSLAIKKEISFSNSFALDGMKFSTPTVHLFSFNTPLGACPTCEGFGDVIGIDPELVIPNSAISIYDNAIAPWKSTGHKKYYNDLVKNAYRFDFPIHTPYFELTNEQKELVWNGNQYFKGIYNFFKKIESKNYKIQNRVLLSRYRGKSKCEVCRGSRLRKEAGYVKINKTSLPELLTLPISALITFFDQLKLTDHEKKVAHRILIEIKSRLQFVEQVGLGYLTLNRRSNTLSGGESQRIRLASQIGSGLTGVLYVLDEPSIGLHQRDNERLLKTLKRLRDLGNTVIVVEHDEEAITTADHVVDLGPAAGVNGGRVVAEGNVAKIKKNQNSITGQYLSGKLKIEIPSNRRKALNNKFIEIIKAEGNNLKNVDCEIPLGTLTCITGVSGSGKSTLTINTLFKSCLLYTSPSPRDRQKSRMASSA